MQRVFFPFKMVTLNKLILRLLKQYSDKYFVWFIFIPDTCYIKIQSCYHMMCTCYVLRHRAVTKWCIHVICWNTELLPHDGYMLCVETQSCYHIMCTCYVLKHRAVTTWCVHVICWNTKLLPHDGYMLCVETQSCYHMMCTCYMLKHRAVTTWWVHVTCWNIQREFFPARNGHVK